MKTLKPVHMSIFFLKSKVAKRGLATSLQMHLHKLKYKWGPQSFKTSSTLSHILLNIFPQTCTSYVYNTLICHLSSHMMFC